RIGAGEDLAKALAVDAVARIRPAEMIDDQGRPARPQALDHEAERRSLDMNLDLPVARRDAAKQILPLAAADKRRIEPEQIETHADDPRCGEAIAGRFVEGRIDDGDAAQPLRL